MPLIKAATISWDAAALDQKVAGVIGDGHHRFDIAVAVQVEGLVVASTR